MNVLIDTLGPILGPLVGLAVAVLLGLALHYVIFRLTRRLTTDLPEVMVFQGALLRRIRRPLVLLLPLLMVRLWLPLIVAPLEESIILFLGGILHVGVVIAVAWLLIGGVRSIEDIIVQRSNVDAADNLRARKALTQAKIIKRIAVMVIAVLALAAILMRFEAFRELGTGLLASAGVAGLVVGLAAQRTLGNLLAGIQLAITQPIRVDDIVIAEGEFGWVEEITLTYIVVRVWDERRIVVPISDFIEKPFQNWTRTSSELLGTVFLYVDYTVPVDALRTEHQRLLETAEEWDGRASVVQVTDASERTVEVRFLQSATSAPKLFNLRCLVREQMIAFVQEHYPGALPRVRAEMFEGENGQVLSGEPAAGEQARPPPVESQQAEVPDAGTMGEQSEPPGSDHNDMGTGVGS